YSIIFCSEFLQFMVWVWPVRASFHALVSRSTFPMLSICLFKHCLLSTCNWISAVFNQLPGLGVNKFEPVSQFLPDGPETPHKAPRTYVCLQLSISSVIRSASSHLSATCLRK